jgi:hypothetical protein
MVDLGSPPEDRRIRQLAAFLQNRLGALLALQRTLEAAQIQVLGLTVVDAADHAVARLVVDQPTLAAQALREGGYAFVESELLGVSFPSDLGIRRVLTAILVAEVNIHYLYSLLAPLGDRSVVVLNVDDPASAARLLVQRGIELVDQSALRPDAS